MWLGTGKTDQGLIRTTNQDSFAVLNHLHTWIVADGMGGHAGGDVASRLAVETITREVEAHANAFKNGRDDCVALLPNILQTAHQAILGKVQEQPKLKSMGTTVVVAYITASPEPCAILVYVGDSRAYLFRDRTLTLLTRDHSLVNRYIREGKLTEQEALTHPERHVLTRALGIGEKVRPEVVIHALHPDDRILLCTDGLTKMLDDAQIAEVLLDLGSNPDTACDALIEEALHWGGEDNVTIILCTNTHDPAAAD
ncbi:MAG: Stp1/IreP family PP2C-type Ser/Thr phosphatase [Nitrospiraceae bacterium]